MKVKEIIKEELLRVLKEQQDYRGNHRAPDNASGSPLYDVTLNGTYPDDLYTSNEALRYYGDGYQYDNQALSIIRAYHNKPNQRVKIYRAVPKVITNQEKIIDYQKQKAYVMKYGKIPSHVDNWEDRSEYYEYLGDEIENLKQSSEPEEKVSINNGDWVGITPEYAKSHGETEFGRGKYRVLTKTVPSKYVYSEGNSMQEWGYSDGVSESLNEEPLTLYRGVGYNEGDNYYSPSKEFAMEFTRSGRESELKTIRVDSSKIYRHDPLPKGYGMEDPNFDIAIKTAQQQGFNAMWVDEGYDQPDSVFIIESSQGIRENVELFKDELKNLKPNTHKVYHGTNNKFENFDLNLSTQGIIWFTDSIDSIKKGEHGGQGSKYIMTRYVTLNNPAGWDEYEKLMLQQIEDMGHDGVILPHGTEYNDYIVFDPKSISKNP